MYTSVNANEEGGFHERNRTDHRSQHWVWEGCGQRLARRGHRVIATMRDIEGRNKENRETLEQLARSESLPLHVVEMDVTDERSVNSAVTVALERYNGLDVVINNAGFAGLGLPEVIPPNSSRRFSM